MISVSTAVIFPSRRGAPTSFDAHRVALVVGDDRFLATPDHRHRLLGPPRRQRQQMLNRKIFAPAERPADRGVSHDDLLLRKLQHRRDLPAILVQPLSRGFDNHPVVHVDVGDASFGLEVSVLLPGGRKLTFEHDVGFGKSPRNISLTDRPVEQDIRAQRFVDERRVGIHRGPGISDCREVFEVDADELGARFRRIRGFGDHERDFVSLETHFVAAEHRLIMIDQSEGIVWNIRRRQDSDDARVLKGLTGIDRADARVRTPGEDNLELQHARLDEIARIVGRARHLTVRIRPGDRRANQRRGHCLAS